MLMRGPELSQEMDRLQRPQGLQGLQFGGAGGSLQVPGREAGAEFEEASVGSGCPSLGHLSAGRSVPGGSLPSEATRSVGGSEAASAAPAASIAASSLRLEFDRDERLEFSDFGGGPIQ